MSIEMEKKKKTSAKKTATAEPKAKVVRKSTKIAKVENTMPDNLKQWPTHAEIAVLAHRYYEERGLQHGFDEQDWYRAEQELMPAS